MYFAKLYKQHKGWFAVVVLFAFGQVFVNYKNGVMVSPFYNYDMYSYKTAPRQEYEVAQIRVNKKLLEPENFSPQQWDNLIQPVLFFEREKAWNSLIYNTGVQHFLPVHDSALYINTVSEKAFIQWYRQHVLRIVSVRDTNSTVTITKDRFRLAQQYLYNQ